MNERDRVVLNKRKLFLILSLCIALIDGLFIAANFIFTKDALLATLEQERKRLEASLDVLLDRTYTNMLAMATFIANDPEVQQTFLRGKKAVEAEGGGPGGPVTAQARQALYDLVGPNWLKVQKDFNVRQLHFHLGPGSTSFLRVHRPEKFGDNMDDVRFIIVDTNREKTLRTGFETGRVYSGLRGIVPMSAVDPDTGETVHVGALEVGTSFSQVIDILDKRYDIGVTVLLKNEHVQSAMWPDFIAKRFGPPLPQCDCVIEATSRDGFKDIATNAADAGIHYGQSDIHIVDTDTGPYIVAHYPLRDYLGDRQTDRADVGTLIFWRDATEQLNSYRSEQMFTALYGVFGYILVEILMFGTFAVVSRRLEKEIALKTEALAQSNQELERFSHIVSHDLQEPLRSVSSFLTLLKRRYGGQLGNDADDYINFAVEGANRMSRMIHDLLEFSRVERKGAAFTATDTEQVIKAALDNLHMAVTECDADVRLEGPFPTLMVDEEQMVRVFQNLIGNGIKYRRPNITPVITIGARQDKDHWHFTVTDNGIGIDPKYHDRIFESFARLHDRATYDGTGMGLTVTKRIVERHGGRLTVDSAADQGATFTVTVPDLPPLPPTANS